MRREHAVQDSQEEINSSLLPPLLTIPRKKQKAQNLPNPAAKLLCDCLGMGRPSPSRGIRGICCAQPVAPSSLPCSPNSSTEGRISSGLRHSRYTWCPLSPPPPGSAVGTPVLSCHQGLSIPKKPRTDSALKCLLSLQKRHYTPEERM